jgi:hypothetical protein
MTDSRLTLTKDDDRLLVDRERVSASAAFG